MSINAGTAMGYLDLDTSKFKKSIKSALSDLKNFKSDSESVSQGLKAIDTAMSVVGSTLTKSVTTPLVGVGIGLSKMTLNFETAFSKTSTLLDDAVVDFGEYKDKILEASTESKIAASDFSEAVYQSISAGVDQKKAIEFTTEAMKLARGGFTSGANAVDLLTTAINAYGMSAEDVTAISDQLITTQNLGKTTVDELASSLGRVIPTANSVGVDLTNVNTAMAILTKNGINTSEAVTYLNSMFNELGKSGTDADKALKEISGQGFKQLIDSGIPVTEILRMLAEYAEESGLALSDMFGSSEAAKSALTIMKDGGVEYNEILKQMANSANATQKAVDKIDASPMEQLRASMNSLKNAFISIGEYLIPYIIKLSDFLTKLANKFMVLTNDTKQAIIKIGVLIASIGPALIIGGKVIGVISGIIKLVSALHTKILNVKETFVLIKAGYAGLAAKMGLLPKLIVALSTSFSTVIAPILGVVAAVGAVIGAFVTLWKTNDDFKNKLLETWNSIKDSFGNFFSSFIEKINDLGYSFTGILDLLKSAWFAFCDILAPIFTGVFDTIALVIDNTLNTILSLMDIFIGIFQGDWKQVGEGIKSLFSNIVNTVTNWISIILNTIGDIGAQILELFGFEEASEAFNNFFESIGEFFTSLPETIMGFVDTVVSFFTDTLPNAFSNFINVTIPNFINSVKTWFSELPYNIGVAVGQMIGHIYLFGTNLINWVTTQLPVIISNIINWFAQLPSRIWEWLCNTVNKVIEWGSNIASESQTAAIDFVQSFINFLKELPEKVWGIIKQIPQKIKNIGETLKQAGKDIFNDLWDGIKSIGESILGWVSDFAGKIGDFVSGIIQGFKDIVSGADSAKTAAKSVDGSHKGGLSYVPFDGYVAELHKGERVLTAEEARDYNKDNSNKGSKGGDTFNFYNTEPSPYEYARQMKKAKRDLEEDFA